MQMFRRIAAIVLGFVAAGVVVALIETPNSLMYPMPEGVTLDDTEAIKAWVKTLPLTAMLVVIAAWFLGAIVGTSVARLTAPQRIAWPAMVVFVVFLAAIFGNLATIPHPVWMWVVGPLAGVIGGGIGMMLVTPPMRVEQERMIQAPLADVFKTISTAEGFSAAVPGITKIEFLTTQKEGVGTRFRETRVMGGKEASSVMEIAEYQPNKLVRMVADEGGTVWDSVFQVSDVGDGTRLRLVMDARPHHLLARIMTPLIMGMISRAIGKDMDAVKAHCESGVSKRNLGY